MGKVKAAPVPASLEIEGRALWRDIAAQVASDGLELDARERRWLRDACAEADVVATLSAGLVDAPLMVRGSQGQDVINPVFSGVRQHREALGRLLARLDLDEPDAEPVGRGGRTTSTSARAAALSRYRRTAS
jgi:hypothetical protein